MTVLAFDTATPATVVVVRSSGGACAEARHDPGAGERPGHGTRLLALVFEALSGAGRELTDVERVAVGTGPGSFTGLRIGVATARGLAQALAVPLVGVSTLRVLAAGAREALDLEHADRPVLAVIDARRGEAFAAAYAGTPELPAAPDAGARELPPAPHAGARELLAAVPLAPPALAQAVAQLPAPPLAVGGGAVRFRGDLEAAGAVVPADESPLHRVDGRQLGELAAAADPAAPDPVLPDYLRPPDAQRRRIHP